MASLISALKAVPAALSIASKARAALPVAARSPHAAEQMLKPAVRRAMPAFAHVTGDISKTHVSVKASKPTGAPSHTRSHTSSHASKSGKEERKESYASAKSRATPAAAKALARAEPHVKALSKPGGGLLSSAWHGLRAAQALRGATRELSDMNLDVSLGHASVKSGDHSEDKTPDRGQGKQTYPRVRLSAMKVEVRRTDGKRAERKKTGSFDPRMANHPPLRVHLAMALGTSAQGPSVPRMAALVIDARGLRTNGGGRTRSLSDMSGASKSYQAAMAKGSDAANAARERSRWRPAPVFTHIDVHAFRMSGKHGPVAFAFRLHTGAAPKPRPKFRQRKPAP